MKKLENILNDKLNRKRLISDFQESVWRNNDADKILSELAYTLDFYEPDLNLRNEDISYFGDERLEEELKLAMEALKEKANLKDSDKY